MKRRLILTSVGTSLLTRHAEKGERQALTSCSNYRKGECPQDISSLVDRLHEKAFEELSSSKPDEIRRASAELNGLIGLNHGNMPSGKQGDMHFLIATDTAQGEATAATVGDFLRNKCGCAAEVLNVRGLSTRDSQCFSEGIKNLLKWCDESLEGYKQNGYEIVFNLTGGFKSLQGYLNTIGMFYADRMVYIFESETADLIEIPKLPIAVDRSCFENNAVHFALLNAGKEYRPADFPGVPAALIDEIDSHVLLSLWGELMWNKVKQNIFSGSLLPFPCLSYSESFKKDFSNTRVAVERVKLQEIIAKVSVLLQKENGSTRMLKQDGGLLYEDFQNKSANGKPIGHFRVTQNLRISCIAENGGLTLRHYGEHDYVNDNP